MMRSEKSELSTGLMNCFDCRERSQNASRFAKRENGLRFRSVTLAWIGVVLVTIASCRAKDEPLVNSLRCGMTKDEVASAARNHGYNKSFPSWLTRSAADPKARSKELELADLTFRNGRLVAVRQGSYNPHTKKITYRTINLCEASR